MFYIKHISNKIQIYFINFLFLLLFLFPIPLIASSEIPGYSNESGPEPPPAAPIDNYLIYTITICVVFVAFYFYKSNLKKLKKNIFGFLFLFAFLNINSLQAQIQNNGSIYISDGSTVFLESGAFSFGPGSTTKTTRTATYGELILGASATVSGVASGAGLFNDGFTSTRRSSYFVLPTGQTTTYAPIGVTNGAVTNGVDAAYYIAAPSTVGATLASTVSALPATGYWVVKGDNAILTMIWTSNISALSNSIANLTVAGYNTSSSKWEAIASATPTGTLTSGTIATATTVTLTNYSAFTLVKRGISCGPVFAASGTTKTWNGSWSPSAPTEIDPAVISSAGSPGSFVCNTLAVNANIIVTDLNTIEVVNGISGLGTITMSSQASILQRNDASSITPTIALTKSTRTGMFANDYIYWGSPLTTDSFSQLAGARAYNNANTTATGIAGAFDSKYKYVSGNATSTGGWQTLTATTPGAGFIMRMKSQAPFSATVNTTDHINLTFTGIANNGTKTANIANITTDATSFRNHNLLANPYPSAIDADKFLEYNTNLDGVVYIWKAQTSNSGLVGVAYSMSDYIAYTRAGSTAESGIGPTVFNGKIATGQGFKVKAITATGTGTATFNNCMRVSGINDQFMRTSSDRVIDRYKLNLTGTNGVGNIILVAYMPGTTLDYDRMYDAELSSVSAAQLYSTTELEPTKQLAINARPSFDNTDVVNLGVSKSNSNSEDFTISITNKEGVFASSAVNVFLHDTVVDVYHNLANGPYQFTSTTAELNNRLQIVYQNATLNTIDFESNNIVATINNQTLKILAGLPMTTISIFDISGRLVTEIDAENQTRLSNAFHFAEGIYIAKIKMNNGTIATRKLVNRK